MERSLQPEILDTLPANDPEAIRSRRDLRLINAALGTHRWLASVLPGLVRPGERVLELGAGTGELGRALLKRGVRVDGIDLCPQPAPWPAELTWHQANLLTFDGYAGYAVVVCNLILHHFNDADLANLGERLRAHSRVILACEPTRRKRSQLLFRVVAPLLGASPVTLHDAHVSIAAGFRNDELKTHLQLSAPAWNCHITYTTPGVCRLVALRQE